MRIGSLCSGYGGLEMGVQAVLGGTVAWHVEYNPDAAKILAHHWPTVPNHGDVKTTDWTQVEPIDVLTAGYPCQPFSHAGRRAGEDDARHLWPDVAQAIRVLRPRLVLLENVAGHLSLGFGSVLGDLATLGYDASWVCIRAADVGAPHGRARVFIAATDGDAAGTGLEGGSGRRVQHGLPGAGRVPPADTASAGLEGCGAERGGTAQALAADDPVSGDAPADAGGERLAQHAGEPPAEEARPRASHVSAGDRGLRAAPDWGPYQPAIARWERVLGRRAPRPTEPGRTGRERLSPAFVEWMMGLPEGHVTAVPGLSRNAQLTALGNGVVPQQAEAAYRILLEHLRATEAAA